MQRYLLGLIASTLLLSQLWAVEPPIIVDNYEAETPTISGGSYQGPFGGGTTVTTNSQANGGAESRVFSAYAANFGIIEIINFSSPFDVSNHNRLEFWFYSVANDSARTIQVQLRLQNEVNPGTANDPIENVWNWNIPVKLSEAHNGTSGQWTKAEIALDAGNFVRGDGENLDILDFTRITGIGVLILNNGASSFAGNIYVDDIRFVEAPAPTNLVDDFDGNQGSALAGTYSNSGTGVDSGLSDENNDPARSGTQSRYLTQASGNSGLGVFTQKTFDTVADVSTYGGLSTWFYSETDSSTAQVAVELVTETGTVYALKTEREIPLDAALNKWTRLFIPLFSSSFQGDPVLDLTEIRNINFIIRANGSTELKEIFIDDIEFVEPSLFVDDFESYSAGAIVQNAPWSLFHGSKNPVDGSTTADNDDSSAVYEAGNGVGSTQNLLLTQGTLPETEGFFFTIASREINVDLSGYDIRNLVLSGDFRGNVDDIDETGLPADFDFIFLIQDTNTGQTGLNGTRFFRLTSTASYLNFEKNLAQAFIGNPDTYPNGNDLDLTAGTYQIQVLISHSDNTKFPLGPGGQAYDLNVFIDNLELKITDTFNGAASLQVVEVDNSQTAKTSITFDGDLERGLRHHTEDIVNNQGKARLIWQAPDSNDWYIRVYTDNASDQTGITLDENPALPALPLKYGIISGAGGNLNDPTVGQSTWDDQFVWIFEIDAENAGGNLAVFKDLTAFAKGDAISGGDRVFWLATDVPESAYNGTYSGPVIFELIIANLP